MAVIQTISCVSDRVKALTLQNHAPKIRSSLYYSVSEVLWTHSPLDDSEIFFQRAHMPWNFVYVMDVSAQEQLLSCTIKRYGSTS